MLSPPWQSWTTSPALKTHALKFCSPSFQVLAAKNLKDGISVYQPDNGYQLNLIGSPSVQILCYPFFTLPLPAVNNDHSLKHRHFWISLVISCSRNTGGLDSCVFTRIVFYRLHVHFGTSDPILLFHLSNFTLPICLSSAFEKRNTFITMKIHLFTDKCSESFAIHCGRIAPRESYRLQVFYWNHGWHFG